MKMAFMGIDFAALIPFALITTFSPGPNTLLSASMGMGFGYKRSLPFLLGIWTGFTLLFIACAFLVNTLAQKLPMFRDVLAVVGSIYILWLAYKSYKASYRVEDQLTEPLGFFNGMVLQLLNPKVIIYGFTIFSTYLGDMEKHVGSILLAPVAFATLSLSATTTWTLFGAAISTFMKHSKVAKAIQTIFALSLVLIAFDMFSSIFNR